MAVVVGKGRDEDQPHGGLARAPSSTLEGEGVDGLRRGEGRLQRSPLTYMAQDETVTALKRQRARVKEKSA